MEGCGANTGYIISKVGFQSGAYDAIERTNINLFTFMEFQTVFRNSWLENVIIEVDKIGYPLRKYCNSNLFDNKFAILEKSKRVEIIELKKKYSGICQLAQGLIYRSFSGNLNSEIELLLESNIKKFPIEHRNAVDKYGLMVYFEIIKQSCNEGILKFDSVYGEKLRLPYLH